MTRKILNFWMLAISISFFVFTSCSSDDDDNDLVIDKNRVEMKVGDLETVRITDGNGDYQATSSNENIAKVKLENTVIIIEGIGEGEATVNIKDKSGKVASVTVVVSSNIYNAIVLEKTEVELEVGDTETVGITKGNGGYVITLSKDGIATATEKDGVITITGVSAGEVTVNVKDKEGKEASIEVTVNPKVYDAIVLEKTEVELVVGDTETVGITEGNGEYVITLSKDGIATATEQDGIITIAGVSAGEVTVNVKDKKGKEASIAVTVNPKDLAGGIAGAYNGTLNISIVGEEGSVDEVGNISLTRKELDKVKMTLINFSFVGIPIGNIEVDDILLEETGGIIKVNETRTTITLPALGNASADVTVSGTVEGTKLKLNIKVETVVIVPLTINVAFDGDKQ